ncbi:MAG: T9SS type A sorting domain-containing protein [Lewinella sp.]|nr:T9SS type A sorting domain-containing protein [Lewinella sp.]
MKRICLFFTVLAACWNLQGQYLENFTGQNGKGLVDAICPPTATGISDCGCACTANPSPTDDISTCTVVPPDLSGVTWTITGSDFTGFDHGSPDDFGVEFLSGNEVFQANDNDNELCWVSPTLNISAAGAVSISIDAGEVDDLEADDYIKAEYSLDGGPFVQFGLAADDFTSTTFSVSGLTGNTLTIRVCIDDNGSSEIIWFDNISVPQSGVFINCNQPTLSAKILDAACGPNSGSIDLTAAGGSPPYSYAWSNGPATQDITGLAPGTYTVTVTDGADCPVVQSYTVGDSPIAQHAAAYAAYCDEANGSVNLTVSGGNAPYTYAWTGGAATEDLTGVAAGDYTVTITDDGGCTSVQTYTVGSQSLSDGPYLEDFSTPGKGYLTNFQDDFFGVNWTLSPWPQGAPGRDASDYFETTAGGVLHAQDVDFEVCWNSPLLNISASGTVQFSVDLTWQTLEPDDYIAVQYSLDGGPFAEVSNIAGGGGRTVQYTSGINSGAGTAAASGLSGGSLQIRICFLAESNSDIITIDNVSVPQTVSLCQGPPDLCPDDPDKTEPGVCGCGVPDTDADNDGTADCNDLCPNDPNKVAPGDCGCGTADTDADNDGVADCIDICPDDPNGNQADSDCDGIGNVCDVCPGGDDSVDNNNDGLPDCAYPPAYAQIISAWKCANNKVYVCHKGKTNCISINALAAHLAHGDYLGPCDNTDCGQRIDLNEPASDTNGFEIYPNPASEKINIDLSNFLGQPLGLSIYDGVGRKVKETHYAVLETAVVEISAQELKLTPGVYYVRIDTGREVTAKAFVISR